MEKYKNWTNPINFDCFYIGGLTNEEKFHLFERVFKCKNHSEIFQIKAEYVQKQKYESAAFVRDYEKFISTPEGSRWFVKEQRLKKLERILC